MQDRVLRRIYMLHRSILVGILYTYRLLWVISIVDLPILEALQDIFAINRDWHFLGLLKYCDSSLWHGCLSGKKLWEFFVMICFFFCDNSTTQRVFVYRIWVCGEKGGGIKWLIKGTDSPWIFANHCRVWTILIYHSLLHIWDSFNSRRHYTIVRSVQCNPIKRNRRLCSLLFEIDTYVCYCH